MFRDLSHFPFLEERCTIKYGWISYIGPRFRKFYEVVISDSLKSINIHMSYFPKL